MVFGLNITVILGNEWHVSVTVQYSYMSEWPLKNILHFLNVEFLFFRRFLYVLRLCFLGFIGLCPP